MPAGASLTPAMRQYFEAKRQYRHAIVFFRMGDFYEMFYEDALVAARFRCAACRFMLPTDTSRGS